MADDSIPNPIDSEAPRHADALLKVLCFLNTKEIQKSLMTDAGLRSVALLGFPSSAHHYEQAMSILKNAGKISSEVRPGMCLRISNVTRAATIQSMNKTEKCAAFNGAVQLLSAAWPFLKIWNSTDVERLQTVKKYVPHIVALRDNCRIFMPATSPSAPVPDIAFCRLLHEQAWLETMMTTVEDMHLRCAKVGLPLAREILNFQKNHTHGYNMWHNRLVMNQCRVEAATASMLGDVVEAVTKREKWVEHLKKEIEQHNSEDDHMSMPFYSILKGTIALHGPRASALSGADVHFRQACEQFDQLRVEAPKQDYLFMWPREKKTFKWMWPKIALALTELHSRSNPTFANLALSSLLSEGGQHEDSIIDDMTSLETGVVLFAMGTVKYFSHPDRQPEFVKEALGLLRRAVAVLKQTHGEEAFWTLTATYRMAVCLYDLEENEEALIHLDKINHAFQSYTRESHEQAADDILLSKARAMLMSGWVLDAIGDLSTQSEVQDLVYEACDIYEEVCDTYVDPFTMSDSHFDNMITPLYR